MSKDGSIKVKIKNNVLKLIMNIQKDSKTEYHIELELNKEEANELIKNLVTEVNKIE